MKLKPKDIVGLLKETWTEWQEDKASRLAAALAYYTAFSIAPLFVIIIAIAAVFLGEQAAQGQIVDQLKHLVGTEAAGAIQSLIQSSQKPRTGSIATIISVALLIFGATNLFTQLQDALNTIWEVAPKPGQGVKAIVKTRVLSFGMVLGVGFLLLVSLILSTVLGIVGNYLGGMMPGLQILWTVLNFLISFGVIALLFALIFKFLPDAKITWGDVEIGAVLTALLFTIGKSLIGLYLSHSGIGSTYGAAGSIVVFLLWVNFSAQILLFGAEFTQVYANKYGSRIVPADHAVPVTEEARAQQGIPRTQDIQATAAAQDRATEQSTRSQQVNSPRREATGQTLPSQPTNSSSPRKRNPAATVLGGLIGISQAVTHLGGGRKNRRNRRN